MGPPLQEQSIPTDVSPAEPGLRPYVEIRYLPVTHDYLEDEQRILEALGRERRLTAAQLASRTGLNPEKLLTALSALRGKSRVARLNTVIESFCVRGDQPRSGG